MSQYNMKKEPVLFSAGTNRKKRHKATQKTSPLCIPNGVLMHVQEILTEHAWKRMAQRGLSITDIAATMMFGSFYHGKKAEIIVVGKKECRHAKYNIHFLQGIHIVLKQGRIVTTYRNRTVQLRYRS